MVILLTTNIFSVYSQSIVHKNKDAVGMLTEFYTKYIVESLKGPDPSRRRNINAIKMHYCTQNLLVKLSSEELDSDPFLKVQDIDSAALQTLTVKRDLKNNNLYQVSRVDSYNHHIITITVSVVKQKDEFKIDDIWQ